MAGDTDEVFSIVLEQADRLFEGEVTRERLAAFDCGEAQNDIWRSIAQAGLHLALVSESNGGAGLTARQGFRLMRRAGYFTLPVPLAETMLANWAWSEAGGELLSAMSSIGPANPSASLSLHSDESIQRLSGSAENLPWGAGVGHAVLFVHDAEGAPFLASVALESMLPGRRNLAFEPHAGLQLDALPIAAVSLRPAPAVLREMGFVAVGALMRCQQMVGAMEHCMDYAIAYAMERQQFGRPIAKFQAIQHMLAEAAGHYAASVAAADLALDAWGRDDFTFNVALAKARIGEAAGKVAEVCHQVHGAMGFTQEHPLHYCTRRLWSWRDEFGGESYWQQRIGESVCAAGGEALWPRLVGN
jgi:acyl-CoA dehydrogenase